MEFKDWLISQNAIVIYTTLAVIVVILVVGRVVEKQLVRRFGKTPMAGFVRTGGRFLLVVVPFLILKIVQPLLHFTPEIDAVVSQSMAILVIVSVAWLLIKGVSATVRILLNEYDLSQRDNLQARKIHTQARVVQRLIVSLVVLLAAAAVLATFDQVRQLGMSLLASAGVFSVVAGFAAQRSLGTVFAGIQIALTQPIRIDDVVVVEGEWGRIEEINLTYVVVRLWDLRRLIVPINFFIERPFANWTRTTADILCAVNLYVDYTMPIEPLRQELLRILGTTPLWNGQVANLQVTDSNKDGLELRALMSANDGPSAWDLRCLVREALIGFVREKYPDSLPRMRISQTLAEDTESGA